MPPPPPPGDPMHKRWNILRSDDATRDKLIRELNISPLIAHLMVTRGYTEREAAEEFLWPRLSQLHSPDSLPDIGKAVERIRRAVRNREKIVVYGDYDVDGTTGSAVLLKFFEQLDYKAEFYIPHRVDEGYGLNMNAVKELIEGGMNLMITVDCGSRAVEEIELMQGSGIDVIVTDHHELGDDLPPAFAVINPKTSRSEYPFDGLCGSAVAFKLAWALSQAFSEQKRVAEGYRKFLMMSLSYVAMGTVADVVPLVGENRIITRFGLTALRESPTPGILALKEKAGIVDRPIKANDIGFRLGPRINAAGRMGHARDALELLTTDDVPRAQELAVLLEDQNNARKKLVKDIHIKAEEQIDELGLAEDPIIVIGDIDWHIGVLGIVASRIVDKHCRPCVAVALNGETGKGSARSIKGFDITEAMKSCADILKSFGGHTMAAGMSIECSEFENFRKRMVDYGREHLTEEILMSEIKIDAEVLLTQLHQDEVNTLKMLEPFGMGNPKPVFAATGLTIAGQPRFMGDGTHVRFYVRQGAVSLQVIAFGFARELAPFLEDGRACSVAFTPEVKTYRGATNVELTAIDVKFE